ncbi:MAG: 4Fe-4S dicluster domain-containing protein [Deltaproteobacteria bacterium]|nr:4Fe-4S dicluster domain-containing protein [Deltaproteobacteria bacterium]
MSAKTGKRRRQKRYAMAMDPRQCVGCAACVLACKAENEVPEGAFRDWIVDEIRGRYPNLQREFRSERCHHCSNPPCVAACPTGASHVAEGGTVLVAQNKCTGCKACVVACPYGARYVHPKGYVDKCTFCAHRTARGQDPACVEICPTNALTFGDADDPQGSLGRLLASRAHRKLKEEAGCRPNLYILAKGGQ